MNDNILPAYPLLISLYYECNRTDDARRLEQRYKYVMERAISPRNASPRK